MPTKNIEGELYTLVKKQRSGISVFRGDGKYLRVGPEPAISRQLETHRLLLERGFPVSYIESAGSDGADSYYIERSLGEKRLMDLFEEDTKMQGNPTDEHFTAFLEVVEKFLRAQIVSGTQPVDRAAFASLIKLERFCSELPEYEHFIRQQFDSRMNAVASYPFVITHGDFNPANLYPGGVIDFEDVSTGPLGYDIVTAVTITDWFPPGDYEYFERYRYTPEQFALYFDHCDTIFREAGYGPLSAVREHYRFFRAVWLVVGMQKWPKLQKYRYDLFIKTYLT